MRSIILLLALVEPILAAEILNIPYIEPPTPSQRLDVYAPDDGENHGVVVWIHGGGWRKGDKSPVHHKPTFFNENGYILVSINHRLVPEVTLEEQAGDVAKAIRFVHDNCAKRGGDPNKMFVMGHSAGAHLAALVCTDERYLKAEGLDLSDIRGCVPVDIGALDVPLQIELLGFSGADNPFIPVFGADPESQRRLSPVEHVAKDKGIPSFLVLHCADRPDTTTQSERFVEKLKAAGVAAATHAAKGKDHGTINQELGLDDDEPTKVVFEFLRRVTAGDRP